MKTRTEHDSMGTVEVPQNKYWGAQTQRSLQHFAIGNETMPLAVIRAFAYLKEAAAKANAELGVQEEEKSKAIVAVCREIQKGKLDAHFPLSIWQTGSGTQTNMNVNEVIANRANLLFGTHLHPNDDVNRSQSSNDTFPTAMHIAAATVVMDKLLPAVEGLIATLADLKDRYADLIKCGRTHLMDAVPLTFGQEIGGWQDMLIHNREQIAATLPYLLALAIGGTAVGTGLNAPKGFDEKVCEVLKKRLRIPFIPADNKFSALSAKDEFVYAHGALTALAANMMKIANDVRWMASGPRCGLGEIEIPHNEPGSSIMPGKVNPTQCEAVTMVAAQVMGNNTTISVAASQGNFQLNVFLPAIAYNYLQSATLLADVISSFDTHCAKGIVPLGKMSDNVERSLMLVTALSPAIGYEKAAQVADMAYREGISLCQACVALGYLDEQEYHALVRPEKMAKPK